MSNRYLDLNTAFNINNSENKSTVSDLESIKKGLLRFLQTPKGSDPFNRNYGSSLYSLLFENEVALPDVQMLLYMDITQFEPRINISPTGIELKKLDNNVFQVTCNFIVPLLNNQPGNITTDLSKE